MGNKAIRPVPTLSTDGWVTDPNQMLPRILLNYVRCNPHQTILFYGNVMSMQETIHKSGNDPDILQGNVQNDLNRILSNYFGANNFTLNVQVLQADDVGLNIEISFAVTVDGRRYDLLNTLLSTNNSYMNNVDAIHVV